MSRSYRKYAIAKDKNKSGQAKAWKKLANRKFRHSKKYMVSNHRSMYKQVTRMSYDIHDYKWLETEHLARQWYRQCVADDKIKKVKSWVGKHFTSEEEYIQFWKRAYKNK